MTILIAKIIRKNYKLLKIFYQTTYNPAILYKIVGLYVNQTLKCEMFQIILTHIFFLVLTFFVLIFFII